jgi:hypothetical protein
VARYEFKITLNSARVRCEIEGPDGKRRTFEEAIRREPHLETISVLEQWLKRWEWIAKASNQGRSLLVPDTFDVLGDNLWNLALNNNIGMELIRAHQGMADEDEDSREPIMLRISFEQEASDLAALPWEYLRWPGSPDGGFYLASHTNLVLGRFLEDFKTLDIRTSDLKVRAIFVELLPQEVEFWEQHQEFRGMLDKLSAIGGAFETEKIYGWNPTEVAEKLEKFKAGGNIDVVHLVAVCEEAQGGPRLYLPGDGETPDWRGQDPQPVVKALTEVNSTRPELVVLHLSDLRGTNPPAHFERLAPSFIKAGIPAVLAMQYPMTHPHGQEFVYNFYSRLTKGEAIGEAVQAARYDLSFGRQPNRHFGAPVLYMQSNVDCRLLRIHTATETPYNVIPDAGPTHSELGLRHLPSDRPASIAQILLREAELNSPDPSTEEELQDWIKSIPWPDDLKKVWLVLQARLRQKQDDPVQVEMYRQWMRMVSDMLKEQKEQ